jgi:hypothetical protein
MFRKIIWLNEGMQVHMERTAGTKDMLKRIEKIDESELEFDTIKIVEDVESKERIYKIQACWK